MENRTMQTKEKKEIQENREKTYSCKTYVPDVDIYETENDLVLLADMPGVQKENVNVHLNDGILSIEGGVEPQEYEGLKPIIGEYNIGHYYRQFTVGDAINSAGIEAAMDDGVLKITLPKVEKVKPRTIQIR